jgi:predicted transcriptional regulator
MTDSADILISLKPRHAEQVLQGNKTIELRRRRPHVEPGTKAWIYATAPVAEIKGSACIERIVTGPTNEVWRNFGKRTGISRTEFDNYFDGCHTAHALVLTDIRVLNRPLSLERMRKLVTGFQPPQFFCRLNGAAAQMRLYSRKSTSVAS